MNELSIYKQAGKMLVFTILAILLCRFSKGYFAPVFVLVGVWCAFANKLGWALVFFVLMPFFVILNPGILPKESPVIGYSMRLGPLMIGLILALRGQSRQGRHRLPFGMIVPFMLAAGLSSATGWAPQISYMKILNFIVFLFGIWFGTQNLQHRSKDVFLLRGFFLALCVFLVWGSIAVIPFPSISYATSLRYALLEGGTDLANEMYRQLQADGLRTLFCGVTNHSQALAPVLVCVFTWVMCDMLFMERSFRKPHVALLLCTLPLLYMTRSRVALVSSLFAMGVLSIYTSQMVALPKEIKNKLRQGMILFGALILVAAVVAQIRSDAMSSWLRKSNENQVDRRTWREALTESRQGLMEYSLYEFRRNPLIGSGFQVAEYTRDLAKNAKGLVVSASIEKGVLPVMVLGETGVLGSACFLIFLMSFFYVCSRRGYYITITMVSVQLMTNMGEATFFSPGGIGGIIWMLCVVGGFTLDTTIIFRKNLQQQWGQMAAMEQARQMQEAGRRRRLGLD